MTVTNTWLENMAKVLNAESYNIPTFNIVATTNVASIDITDTTLSGIIGTGVDFDSARVSNITSFTAIRSGTDVITGTGDTLKSAGMSTANLSGSLMAGVVIDELQTTAFDLEFVWDITANRR